MNIILAGMPGCGKTTVAEVISARYGYNKADTDAIIVEKFGEINKIFAERGEQYFRNLENQTVKTLSSSDNKVIATGGGCVVNSENVELFKRSGRIIYLKTSVGELIKRLGNDTTRPLLKGNLREKLNELYKNRAEIYENVADITVVTDNLSPEDVAALIMKRIGESNL